jgi:hypothetical protein
VLVHSHLPRVAVRPGRVSGLVRAGGVEHGEQLLKVDVGREEHVVLAGHLLEETTHVFFKKEKRQRYIHDKGQKTKG